MAVRNVVTAAAGIGLVLAGVASWSVPAAAVTAGVVLIIVGLFIDLERTRQ